MLTDESESAPINQSIYLLVIDDEYFQEGLKRVSRGPVALRTSCTDSGGSQALVSDWQNQLGERQTE